MHDPMTVAFDVKYPWRTQGRRNTFATIWHVDPCSDGSDDSCGYSFPKLTNKQRKRIEGFAFGEGSDPHFLRSATKRWTGSIAEAECLYRGLVLLTAQAIGIRMTADEASLYAISRIHNGGIDVAADILCWLPGYHCNGEDSPRKRRESLSSHMFCIARDLLRHRRHWWQHPKWHIHHWKIQIHPLQTFKRWAFSRCAGCGKRFDWGYCPTSGGWGGKGPRWFRKEDGVYHGPCFPRPNSAQDS